VIGTRTYAVGPFEDTLIFDTKGLLDGHMGGDNRQCAGPI